MNKVYRLIWSRTKEKWIAVSEKVASCRFRRPLSIALVLAPLVLSSGAPALALDSNALPTGGQVTSGTASISTSGSSMTIDQTTDKMITEWDTFNIGCDESVTFNQPGSSSVALNRIMDQNPSQIYGSLTANGQVFLMNLAGIYFSPTARVDVAGLVASTLDITDENFLAGEYDFLAGDMAGSIINEGTIDAFENGYIAFLAPEITNSGTMTATNGTIAMAAGDRVTLDFTGDGLVSLSVDQGAVDALIENKGIIRADGGAVLMTAEAANELTSAAINNTGIIQARTLENREGRILLLADMDKSEVRVGGTLDASAPDSGDGGFIETSAATVTIADDLSISTLSADGDTGTWLIDPEDFTIAASGGDMTGDQVSTALASTDLEIQSSSGSSGSNGDIFINDSITWSANKLTLNAYRNIEINAELFGSGTAQLALYYGQGASDGVISGTEAGYSINAPVNLAAGNNFFTRLGSDGAEITYYVITGLGSEGSTTGTDLQGINGNLSGNYVLGADIDASATSSWNSGTGFVPIGNSSTKFTGAFNGLGHTISDLYINRPSTDYVGLFGRVGSSGSISNVGLVDNDITGDDYVGGLVGKNSGEISSSYAIGAVSGDYSAGGLVGDNSGEISSSYATGAVLGDEIAGGLVGWNYNGEISQSYATGAVSGDFNIGGLVGLNWGYISQSYATGAVNGNSYIGGLVGFCVSSVTNSFYDKETTGQSTSDGGTGLTTAEMMDVDTFLDAGWDIDDAGGTDSTWRIYDGNTYPLLRSFLTSATAQAGGSDRTYDGTTDVSGGTYTWLTSVDTSKIYGTASYALDGKDAGARTITMSGLYSDQQGYDISYADGTLVITPKELTVSGITASDKVYDGTTTAAVDTASAVYNGLIAGDDLTVSATGEFSDKNAGTNKTVTLTGAYSGTDTGNYIIMDQGTTTASITPKDLTASYTGTDKVYDGTTVATVTGSSVDILSGDTVTFSETAAFDDKNAGTDKIVNVTDISISGADASNYSLLNTTATTTADITSADLTVTANDDGKTYDGVAYSGGNGVAYSGFVNGEDSSVLGGSISYGGDSQGAVDAGTYTITVSGLSSENYEIAFMDGNLVINPLSSINNTSLSDTSYLIIDALESNLLNSEKSFNGTAHDPGITGSDLRTVRLIGTGAGSYSLEEYGTRGLAGLTEEEGEEE